MRGLVGLLVLLVLIVGGDWARNRHHARQHSRLATEALQQEDFEQARGHLTESLRYGADPALTYYLLARTTRRANQFMEAREFLTKAAEAGYDDDRITLEHTLLEVQQGNWRGKEMSLVARVVAHDPDAARIHEALATAFFRENLIEPGLTEIDHWLVLEPASPTAWELCGLLYERLGHPDKALEAFLKAIRYDPERFPARLGAGNMAFARSQMELSAEHFAVAIRIRPKDWEARIGLARALADLQRYEEAKTQVEFALILEPNSYLVLGTAGRIAMLSGDYTTALKYFQLSTATVSDSKILMDYRQCLARMRRTDEARQLDARIKTVEDDLERINSLRAKMRDPNDPAPRVEAGRLLIKNGLYNEGRGWLQEALKVAPHYAPAHLALAEMYEKMQRPDLAALHYRQAGKK